MATRKRKTTTPATDTTPETIPTEGTASTAPDVFDEIIAAREETATESIPQTSTAAAESREQSDTPKPQMAFQPDPTPFMSISLAEGNDAPRIRLFRNRRMNQVAIRFDEKPDAPHRERLREEGYKWREAEGVWTKQLGEERASGQLAAERLVEEIANAIRIEGGLAPVGRSEGR